MAFVMMVLWPLKHLHWRLAPPPSVQNFFVDCSIRKFSAIAKASALLLHSDSCEMIVALLFMLSSLCMMYWSVSN
jgi:hypothetical protein